MVQVGAVRTVDKNAEQGLMPLFKTRTDELRALLNVKLAQEAKRTEPRVVAPKPNSVVDVEQAILGRASNLHHRSGWMWTMPRRR